MTTRLQRGRCPDVGAKIIISIFALIFLGEMCVLAYTHGYQVGHVDGHVEGYRMGVNSGYQLGR